MKFGMGDVFEDAISWFGVTAIVSGLIFFYVLKYHIEPWVIETTCRELVKCG